MIFALLSLQFYEPSRAASTFQQRETAHSVFFAPLFVRRVGLAVSTALAFMKSPARFLCARVFYTPCPPMTKLSPSLRFR
jgi:hypothetical protein